MNYQEYKSISLAIKNDIDFDEFSILCSRFNYGKNYLESIWKIYCEKPLEFVLYHETGRELFEYLKHSESLVSRPYLP